MSTSSRRNCCTSSETLPPPPGFSPPDWPLLRATSSLTSKLRSAGKSSDATSSDSSRDSALDNGPSMLPHFPSSQRRPSRRNPNSDQQVSSSKVLELVCFPPSFLLSFWSLPFLPAKNSQEHTELVLLLLVCFPLSELRLPLMLSDLLLITQEVLQKWLSCQLKSVNALTHSMLLVTPQLPPEKVSRSVLPSLRPWLFLPHTRLTLAYCKSTSPSPQFLLPRSSAHVSHTSSLPSP